MRNNESRPAFRVAEERCRPSLTSLILRSLGAVEVVHTLIESQISHRISSGYPQAARVQLAIQPTALAGGTGKVHVRTASEHSVGEDGDADEHTVSVQTHTHAMDAFGNRATWLLSFLRSRKRQHCWKIRGRLLD
jgi:hypothetical protein